MEQSEHLSVVQHMTYDSRILVVEDDTEIAQLVKMNLEDQGHEVVCIYDGSRGYEKIREESYDLIVLDLMLPGMDGEDICKTIRAEGDDVPMLMLTAKSEEFDKVLGLELGADDYVTKPFGIRELMARVKALLRRSQQQSDAGAFSAEDEKLELGELVMEPQKWKVSINGESVELTEKEFQLLHLFMKNPGRAFSRDELLNEIWGYQFSGYEHTVNTHINRLRTKIEEKPSDPRFLKTVWGVGYRFADQDELD